MAFWNALSNLLTPKVDIELSPDSAEQEEEDMSNCHPCFTASACSFNIAPTSLIKLEHIDALHTTKKITNTPIITTQPVAR
jgi:hypothetical protein